MEMQVRQEGALHIVSCQGRMDANVSGALKDRIQQLVDKGATRLVLDLEGVDFLDSSGLGVLVACLRRVREKQGEIKLSGLRPEVRSIFEITRVSRLFHICGDVAEAAAAFSG
ncbi:MAG: STAS domain-containing protein [bacterium]